MSYNSNAISSNDAIESHIEVTQTVKTKLIRGQVIDENKGPLPGVTITTEGAKHGTITDMDGFFQLKIEESVDKLHFSFVGMKTKTVILGTNKLINVQLFPSAIGLDEVVAVGFGTQKKANLTGSVASVGEEAFSSRPVSNVTQALQGKVAGLSITTNKSGGTPGASKSINIRGLGSVNGKNAPYVLVDGIEMSLDDINPNDIAQISVLKDAAASAIYGARAAYGVILVTTKNGKEGIHVNYSNNFSFSTATNLPNKMNSLDFVEYYNDAAHNSGQSPVFNDEMIDRIRTYMGDPNSIPVAVPKTTDPTRYDWGTANANTDWYDEHFKSWVPSQTHNISISGGNGNTKFYLSGGYFTQDGILKYGDDKYTRKTINAKLETKIASWITVKGSILYRSSTNDKPSTGIEQYFHDVSRLWPTYPIIDPNGNFTDLSKVTGIRDGGRNIQEKNLFGLTGEINFEPIKNWVTTVRINKKIGFNESNKSSLFYNGYLVDGSTVPLNRQNSLTTGASSANLLSPQVFTTYKLDLAKDHHFNILAGVQQELKESEGKTITRKDLITQGVVSVKTAVGDLTASDNREHSSTQSLFGRFNYNYKGKYLIEMNARADGTSRFAEGSRWGFFPSVSLGYDIAKEGYFKSLTDHISQLKVRFSYGSLGNQNVANYLYLENMKYKAQSSWILGSVRDPYMENPNIKSSSLTWEVVTTKTIGLDIALLNNRLTGTFDFYEGITSDMLGPSNTVPAVLGTGAPKENNAEMRTRGIDFSLSWKDKIGDFNYFITGTLNNYSKEITSYKNDRQLINNYYVGKEIGEIWGYRSNGLFQSEEEVKGAPSQKFINKKPWQEGDVRYEDLNGDNEINKGKQTIQDHGDLEVIGNTTPKMQYGISLGASWKGFDFSMFIQGVGKRDLWLDQSYFFGIVGNKHVSSAFNDHKDYWTPENTNAYYARPYMDRQSGKNQQKSSRYLQNGAYIRLKNLQLGYSLPSSLLQKWSITKIRLFVSGENLWTHSNLADMFDPEATSGKKNRNSNKAGTGNGKIYPLQMVLSTGISVSF
ncbi:TonB-dependent receptor [Halosquirtibacter xylanolyticus]|uniref:SusC/RagA family TonB-linked outer membrane protein n=1 Tax=Halosquirtibacter xylanolyticus TaxID=3374599 RepID=UPI003748B04B|nr:TonB-dependent receptor [Prolixibacteraceae bacterium]